tara:strand:- start:1146 stop:2867 length:1722 start_codon:yes stop_codon:yes gene_type:complete
MKRGLIILVLILSIIPFANAEQLVISDFSASPATVQLGDQFTISGEVSAGEESLDSGFVIIHLTGTNFVREYSAEITEDGRFSLTSTVYRKSLEDEIQEGSYVIDITAKDGYGEETFFSNIGVLTLSKALKSNLELAQSTVNPGDTIKIIGSAQKTSDELIAGTVTFVLDEETYQGSFTEGAFEFEIDLKDDVASYSHTIAATVEDQFGNAAENTLVFSVTPIENSLSIILDKWEFLAGEQVEIQASLIDQAGDEISKDIDIEVKDGRTTILESTIKSTDSITLELDEFAEPGKWTIEVKSSSLESTTEFVVKSSAFLDIKLEGTNLIVENKGNIEYTKKLIITAINEDQQYTLERRTNLKPGESTTIKLVTALEQGTYDISVLDNTFNDVEIVDSRSILEKMGDSVASVTGNAVVSSGSSTSNVPLVLVILIVAFVLTYVLRRKRNKNLKVKTKREEEIKKAKKYKQGLREKVANKLKGPFKSSKSDVETFKQRILDNAKKEEERQRHLDKDKKRSSILGMMPYSRPKPSTPKASNPKPTAKDTYIELKKEEKPKEEPKKEDDSSSLFKMFD